MLIEGVITTAWKAVNTLKRAANPLHWNVLTAAYMVEPSRCITFNVKRNNEKCRVIGFNNAHTHADTHTYTHDAPLQS